MVWAANVLVVRTTSIIMKQGMWNITTKLEMQKVTRTLKEVLLKVTRKSRMSMKTLMHVNKIINEVFGQWNWEIAAEENVIIGKEYGED